MYGALSSEVVQAIRGGLVAYGPALIVVLAAIGGIAVVVARRRRIARSRIHAIDRMDREAFDRRLELLFGTLGYFVRRTPAMDARDADLIVSRHHAKTAVRLHQSGKYGMAGVEAVEHVLTARTHFDCDSAIVVTNGRFSAGAQALATERNVELWERKRLVRALLAEQGPQHGLRDGLVTLAIWIVFFALVGAGGWGIYLLDPQVSRSPAAAEAAVSAAHATGNTAPTSAAPVAAPTLCGRATVTSGPGANLRSAPGSKARVLELRATGAVVELLCDGPVAAEGRVWRHVRSDGTEGWMSAALLKLDQSNP